MCEVKGLAEVKPIKTQEFLYEFPVVQLYPDSLADTFKARLEVMAARAARLVRVPGCELGRFWSKATVVEMDLTTIELSFADVGRGLATDSSRPEPTPSPT